MKENIDIMLVGVEIEKRGGKMNRECKGFEVITQDNGLEALVTYFLESFDDEYAKYGIYVEKEIDEQLVEKERTGGFAEDREVAERVLDIVIRNQITPCVLNEVVYDFLDERIGG